MFGGKYDEGEVGGGEVAGGGRAEIGDVVLSAIVGVEFLLSEVFSGVL